MADLARVPAVPGQTSELEVLSEAAALLKTYGFEVVVLSTAFSKTSCDLVLKRLDPQKQVHWYLVELKNNLHSEFVPSSSLSTCADFLSPYKESLRSPFVTCVYSTNAKLGEAGSRLSKRLDLTVLPEVRSGSTLAAAIRDLATSER